MSTVTFVEQLFTRFLGRSADAGGRDYWVNLIDSGSSNATDATLFFVNSGEFSDVVLPIAKLYYAAFGRIPDGPGLNYWVTTLRSGATMQQIASDFVRSAEFTTLYGANVADSAFVDLLYKNVLGRPADAGGKAYWLARLTTDKAPRAAVLLAFASSPELAASKNPEIRVVSEYQNILGIAPTKLQIDAALHADPGHVVTQLYSDSAYAGVPVPYLNNRGVVLDGYLRDSLVFVDTNGNHMLDPGEATVKADAQGIFNFQGLQNYNGVLIAQNGRDIATGLLHTEQLLAPSGSTVITPLTNLLQTLIDINPLGQDANATLLANHLQLDPGIDLTRFDPIASAIKPGATDAQKAAALKIHMATAKLTILITEGAAYLHGSGIALDPGAAEQALFQSLSQILIDPDLPATTDLTSATVIRQIISGAGHALQASDNQQTTIDKLAASAAAVIANINSAIGAVAEPAVLDSLTKIAVIEYVAISFLSLLEDGASHGNVDAAVQQSDPAVLANAINAAAGNIGQVVLDTVAPTLTTSIPANHGGAVSPNADLILNFSEPVLAGHGNIIITNGSDVRTIAIDDPSQISINGNSLTINPTLDLQNGSTYRVLIDKTAITDLVGNPFAGISEPSTLSFVVPSATVALSGLNGGTGTRLDALVAAGASVSAAGDVNGDGFDDFLISASSGNNTGSAYLVLGKSAALSTVTKLSALAGRDGVRFDGAIAGDFTGSVVGGGGDVNNDGFADILLGAPGASPGAVSQAGSAYVVFGKQTAFASTVKLATPDGKTGFRIDGASANDRLGSALANAGDVNGDGITDIIVGANGSANNTGSAYVVFGKPTATGFPGTLNVSTLDGSNGFQLTGIKPGDNTGFSVSGAGDVNGDGYADVLVGAFSANGNAGAAYLVFGQASGFAASINLSTLDGSNGVRFDGLTDDNLGRSVAKIGDINGDGIDDFVIGAFHANANTGSAYVVFGKHGGFDPTIDIGTLDGQTGFRIDGVNANDLTGISVASAGDINGDGLADLLVGARDANGQSGSTYLIYGSSNPFTPSLNLASLNGVNGFRLNGPGSSLAGAAVAGVGDTNGDGFDDFLIGAPGTANTAGSSYLVLGNYASAQVQINGTSGNDTLTGTAAGEVIFGGLGNDTITGGGGADVIHGGAGNDRIIVPDLNFQLIDGGSGNDTLVLSGAGLALHLPDEHGHLRNIETIDITGSGDNELFLTAQDVLALSPYTNRLLVVGNAGDKLHLGATWIPDTPPPGMKMYHLGQAVIVVGSAVTVDFT